MKYHSNKNEKQLVKNLSKGNFLAFNTLFKEYSGCLYYFARGYLKSEAESEELVQEVFTRVWQKRSELKEGLSFRSYLFTIAFNIIKKHFRIQTHLSQYFETRIFEDIDMQTSQKTTYDSLYQYVTDLVNRLPGKRREIFIKSRFEGLNVKEIAQELNLSHKTVENQLTVALKYLRKHLKRESLAILFFILFI